MNLSYILLNVKFQRNKTKLVLICIISKKTSILFFFLIFFSLHLFSFFTRKKLCDVNCVCCCKLWHCYCFFFLCCISFILLLIFFFLKFFFSPTTNSNKVIIMYLSHHFFFLHILFMCLYKKPFWLYLFRLLNIILLQCMVFCVEQICYKLSKVNLSQILQSLSEIYFFSFYLRIIYLFIVIDINLNYYW